VVLTFDLLLLCETLITASPVDGKLLGSRARLTDSGLLS